MKPLDHFNKSILSKENARIYLNSEEFTNFCSISDEEKNRLLKDLLEKPISEFTVVNELFFRSKWAQLLDILYGEKCLTLLEIATGDADMIPQALARHNPNSHYVTANMNKTLNESLLNKTKDLPLKITLFDDDAINIEKHIGEEEVDLIAFQHSVNDVVQAILCVRDGIDTVYSDWMGLLPKMIEMMQNEVKNDSLEINAKPTFLELIKTLMKVLKKDGIIAINHYMFQLDLDWGYPPPLWENFAPIARKWISELSECKEFKISSFDEQWWIFIKKTPEL